MWPRPLGHTRTPDGLEQAQTKNGAVLLQNLCGPDPPFGHTRALEGPFSDPGSNVLGLGLAITIVL